MPIISTKKYNALLKELEELKQREAELAQSLGESRLTGARLADDRLRLEEEVRYHSRTSLLNSALLTEARCEKENLRADIRLLSEDLSTLMNALKDSQELRQIQNQARMEAGR
jgi:hypothetical protein